MTGCVVSAEKKGFDCAHKSDTFFLDFRAGGDLKCISPQHLEDFLKACKTGTVLMVPVCQIDLVQSVDPKFFCTDVAGNKSFISLQEADNYYCVDDQDLKRIKERCDRKLIF